MLEIIIKKIIDNDDRCEIFETDEKVFIYFKHKLFKFKNKKIKIFENTDLEWSFSIINLTKRDFFPKKIQDSFLLSINTYSSSYADYYTTSKPQNSNKIYVYEYDIKDKKIKKILIKHINSRKYTFKY